MQFLRKDEVLQIHESLISRIGLPPEKQTVG